LISIQYSLLVYHNLCAVRSRAAHSRRNRRRIRLYNDPVQFIYLFNSPWEVEVEDAPIVYRLVQTENHTVQVLQHGPLLDLVPQEQVDCLHKCGQRRVQHQFVLLRAPKDVEDKVQRVSVHPQMSVV
jgi:hypothetical protein